MTSNNSCCFNEADEIHKFSVADKTWRYCTPVIIALGTVGNGVSLLVLQRSKMKTNILAKQLTMLAASNLLVLYFTLLIKYLLYVQNVSLLDSLVTCKLIHWLSEPIGLFNSWLMVAITAERFGAVMRPLHMRSTSREISANKQIFFIAVFFLFINLHAIYGRGHEYDNNTERNTTVLIYKCGFVSSKYKTFYSYWVIVEIVLLFYLPITLLFTGNIAIVLKLKQRYSNIAATFKDGQTLSANQLGSRAIQTLSLILLLNTGFILCTAPISIVFFVYEPWNTQNGPIRTRSYTVIYAITNMIMYVKYSIGFLFFTVISDFRNEICRLFGLGKHVKLFNPRMSVYSVGQVSFNSNDGSIKFQGEYLFCLEIFISILVLFYF